MYGSEADYTGLGALHPNDPSTIYISTSVDPRDEKDWGIREIFRGVTEDDGATWTWTPVTRNSLRDNFRPIVPTWDQDNTALLWWRGNYSAAQRFDAAVVGILDRSSETVDPMHYIDATLSNTNLPTGGSLVVTGPSPDQGAADDHWHERTGFGNDGSVLTSSEISGEDAPALMTQVTVPEQGTYDVWVNFWANPNEDWRIKAGLTEGGMQIFRQMACRQVENGDHDASLVLTGDGGTYIYQAYLGRVQLSDNLVLEVFVDDYAVETGSAGTLIGGTARTWYDGISYAVVNGTTDIVEKGALPFIFTLDSNYPNPFNPATTIPFTLRREAQVSLKIFNLKGREVATLINARFPAGTHKTLWDARDLPSGVYFAKLTSGNNTETLKMTLLR
jgi:hypothetical protein